MSEEKEDQFRTVTSKWSDNIEKVIKDIGDSCQGYKWMNISAAKQTSLYYNILVYILIFIGPLSGILSTISINEENPTKVLNILITIFTFMSGVISTIIKFSKYEQKSASYKSIAAKYASLEGNIRRQLSLSREDRVNAGKYLEWVSTSFDELFISAPLISTKIYNGWVEHAKKNQLQIPKPFGEVAEVNEEIEEQTEENIEKLSNTKDIPVNKTVNKENNKGSGTIEIVVKNNPKITHHVPTVSNSTKHTRKRSHYHTSTLDLNKFSDPEMKYQMSRLYGFSK